MFIDKLNSLTDEQLLHEYAEAGYKISALLAANGVNKESEYFRSAVRDRLTKMGVDTSSSVLTKCKLYGKDALEDAIQNSLNFSECLKKLGFADVRSNRTHFLEACKFFNIPHPTWQRKIPTVVMKWDGDSPFQFFADDEQIPSNCTLKSKYLNHPTVKSDSHNCAICGIDQEWNGRPLLLQLDHIDGNKRNNILTNLRLLCPNCHSQTDTFVRKNVNAPLRVTPSSPTDKPTVTPITRNNCKACGSETGGSNRTYCSVSCRSVDTQKITRPDKDELVKMIRKLGYLQLAKVIGVSDNAIRKWVKSYGLDPKSIKKS